MREEYEQLELDTRTKLESAILRMTNDTINTATEMIRESHRQIAVSRMIAPPFVRNRHEAYGIAAENYSKCSKAINTIKADVASLLDTLSDPNRPALEATSSICNSTSIAAYTLITAAAEMKRTLDDLYTVENAEALEEFPLEDYLTSAEFEPAESAEPDEPEQSENSDDYETGESSEQDRPGAYNAAESAETDNTNNYTTEDE